MRIGILALQGDFDKHQQMLERLKVESALVKTADQLHTCAGLILPGGESTTFALLLRKHGLLNEVKEFSKHHPVFGTCAGLITLAAKVNGGQMETLGLIDIEAERNAYGRQVDSFIDNIKVDLGNGPFEFEGVFIRAPKIKKTGPGVRALAWHGEHVVLAQSDKLLVATFHPELTDNTALHEYFCRMVVESGAD